MVLSVVGALVGLGFAVALFRVVGPDTSVSTQARGYVVESDRSVQVEFEVARDPGQVVSCVIRARAVSGAEIGRRQFDVPASTQRSTVVRESLPTTERANTGELVGCRAGTSDEGAAP